MGKHPKVKTSLPVSSKTPRSNTTFMPSGNDKTPRANSSSASKDSAKNPRVGEQLTEPHDLKPVWRLQVMDLSGPFSWTAIDSAALASLRDKLGSFETMTWREITFNDGTGSHRIAVKDLGKPAQARLRTIKQDDVDELMSLRISGKVRVWGIMEGNTMKILWWDPEHQVYPVQKRNT